MKAIRGSGKGECQIFIDRRGRFFDAITGGPTIDPAEVFKDQLENNPYQILCRTNIEAKTLQKLGLKNATTIHQAKGIEFKNVLLIDFEFDQDEINKIKERIDNYKNQINFLESTYTFKWLKSDDIEKDKIILNFIKNRLNNV
jgi:hypothetical protein